MIELNELRLMLLEDFFIKADEDLVALAKTNLDLDLSFKCMGTLDTFYAAFVGDNGSVAFKLLDPEYLQEVLLHFYDYLTQRIENSKEMVSTSEGDC